MSFEHRPRYGASPYQDYFDAAFKAVDLAAVWWSPFLKGVGRSQLEIAGMQSKNARSMIAWGRAVATSRSPAEIVYANVALCESIFGHVGEALPRVSGALTQATQPPAAFEVMAPPAPRRERDLIEISIETQKVAA